MEIVDSSLADYINCICFSSMILHSPAGSKLSYTALKSMGPGTAFIKDLLYSKDLVRFQLAVDVPGLIIFTLRGLNKNI